jgi:hypothetical protein
MVSITYENRESIQQSETIPSIKFSSGIAGLITAPKSLPMGGESLKSLKVCVSTKLAEKS